MRLTRQGSFYTATMTRRDLSDLLNLWWLYHGQTAENGTIEKRQLMKTIRQLNDPSINRLNKHVLLEHRSNRLADGIKASTINRDMYRLSGMITTLQKLEVFSGSNARSTPHIRESLCDERWKHCCTATNTRSCQYTTNYGVCSSGTRLFAICNHVKSTKWRHRNLAVISNHSIQKCPHLRIFALLTVAYKISIWLKLINLSQIKKTRQKAGKKTGMVSMARKNFVCYYLLHMVHMDITNQFGN